MSHRNEAHTKGLQNEQYNRYQKMVAEAEGFKVFCSKLNSKGKTLVSIVRGAEARNKNEGDLVYSKTFESFDSVSNEEMFKIGQALK